MKLVFAEYPETWERDINTELAYLPEDTEIAYAIYREENLEPYYEALSSADAVISGFAPIDRTAIDYMKNCKIISVEATGYNFVDVDYAKSKGIAVSCVGEYCTQEVADHTMALMLALMRDIPYLRRRIEEDQVWEAETIKERGIHRIEGQTLGILGFGRIGRAVARRAAAFNLTIVAYDPYVPDSMFEEFHTKKCSFDELLEISDIITIHMNLTEENKGMLDMKKFRKMKKHPILLNVARGGAVVQADLTKALEEGLLRGAGLDVLESESPDLTTLALLHKDNVLMTPHTAFYSDESIEASEKIAASNVTYYLEGNMDKVFRLI